MNDYTVPRSPSAQNVEQLFLIGATVATATLALLCIRFVLNVASSVKWYSGITVFIIIAVIGYVALLANNKKWRATKYKFTTDAILVASPSGMAGVSKEVFLYESVISAHLTQGYLGKKFDYGDIVLAIPKLENQVKLTNLASPKQQLEVLQSQLKHKSPKRQTLVT